MELKYLETKLSRATTLPILSKIVAQVLLLTKDPNASTRDFEILIRQDTALTAKILRLANSPIFNGGSQITTLRGALTQIGSNTLRSICLTISVQVALREKNLNKNFHPGNFWLHSLAVAYGAKILAYLMRDAQSEEAYIAGLLHDVGKLALCLFLPKEADGVYTLMQAQGLSQFDAEMLLLQVTHQDIGYMAAQRWQLSEAYLLPISRHHNPVENGEIVDRLTAYVHVGNVIAHEIGLGLDNLAPPPCADPVVMAMLNIAEEQYETIQMTIANEVQKLGSLVGL